MGPAKSIKLENVPGPTSAQWRLFLEVTLCGCPRLVHVNLSRNEAITDATLQPFAALHNSLEYLKVAMSAGFRGSLEPLRSLHKLRELYLSGCVAVEGSVEPLSGLQVLRRVDVEACFGLVGGLDLLAALPQLKFVNACDTQLDAASFVAERQRVLQLPEAAVAKEAGGAVVVGGCRVGRYGDETTPLWWAASDGQVETARRLLAKEGWSGRRGGGPGGGKRWDYTLVEGGIPELPSSCPGAAGAPRRCEQGERQWFHSTLVRRAKGFRPGGHVAPRRGRRREQGREGWADTAPPCQCLRPQGRGGDASRCGRRQDGGVPGLDRAVVCPSFGPP